MVKHGILAKIMVSLCTILHGHGILAKIMARSWQDHGKILARLPRNLPWILARMPWFRTLGNFIGRNFRLGVIFIKKNWDFWINGIIEEMPRNSVPLSIYAKFAPDDYNSIIFLLWITLYIHTGNYRKNVGNREMMPFVFAELKPENSSYLLINYFDNFRNEIIWLWK